MNEVKPTIMIVDDDAEIRALVRIILEESDYHTLEAGSGTAVKEALDGPRPDVILLDFKLPDADGLTLLPQIKKKWPDTQVIVFTGYGSTDLAVEATKLGAYHFLNKPFDPNAVKIQVERALEHKQITEANSALRRAISSVPGSPVFQSASMKEVLRTVERVAPSDVSVLLTGESGSGKEVIADLLHSMSPRCKGPIIKINCAALPRELIESELFGSTKGAFTGAQADREGLFRQAEGGTLLLDELSEMPIDTQSKLLRVLQEKEVRPVGGRVSYKTDCRIIASTNRLVEDAIREGKMREDLYYRIGAVTIYLPPLRDRRDDILPMANAFLKRYAAQAGRVLTGFSPEAADQVRNYEWPGNVRQLQNEIQRAVLMVEGYVVESRDLSISTAVATTQMSDEKLTLMEAMERNAIVQMLKDTRGNKLETAKRLGIGRQTLYNKIKAYAIDA